MNKEKKMFLNGVGKKIFEHRYFELIGVFALFAFIFISPNETLDIKKSELINLNVTATEIFESSGRRELFKIKFKTNEYSNSFGIGFGGTSGRWSEIIESIVPNNKIRIKILKENLKKLKDETKIVPIYFLSNESRVIFDEFEFNEKQESQKRTTNIACFIIFILLVGRILLKE